MAVVKARLAAVASPQAPHVHSTPGRFQFIATPVAFMYRKTMGATIEYA
jgi:hypothetical protein